MDLPLETRRQIYGNLLVAGDSPTIYSKPGDSVLQLKPGLHSNILRTCKQVFAEASEVMMRGNLFVELISNDPNVEAWLARLMCTRLGVRRNVSLDSQCFTGVVTAYVAAINEISDVD